MCGRAAEAPELSWNEYVEVMGFDRWMNLHGCYNVPPSAPVACFRRRDGVKRSAFTAEWGFRTKWKEHEPSARAETVAKTYPTSFKFRRCVVVVNGFFEWDQNHAIKRVPKQPYYFSLTNRQPMAFAGLWDGEIDSPRCVVITTTPNSVMQPFHNRQPVILTRSQWDPWLDDTSPVDDLKAMLVPSDPLDMQCWPVTKRMNSTRKQDYIWGPECIEQIELQPQVRQRGFLFD